MSPRVTSTLGLGAVALATASFACSALIPASAFLAPGTPAKDVHLGRDDDNAANTFVQPRGVAAQQHMDDTDVLVGRANDDLLVGNLGGDTLLGNGGADILVGGPERSAQPSGDVLLGEGGDDVNIWSPGDGSDAFVGHTGYDVMVFAPLLEASDGTVLLERSYGRRIPRVDIDGAPQFSCTIVPVPERRQLGFDFLVRFNVDDVPVATVRQERVESVYCPSPRDGHALVADLTATDPAFTTVRLDDVRGVVGAILAPQG
jgi:hypothetical protein